MDIVVTCCVRNDDALLMVQEAKEKAYGLWNFPSGKLEPLEDVFEGAKREVKEETGYEIRPTGLLTIHNYIRQRNPILRIVFNAEIVSGQIQYDEREILKVKWIPIDEMEQLIPQMRSPESALDIIDSIKGSLNFPLGVVRNIVDQNIK